jgi:hypothetical protein
MLWSGCTVYAAIFGPMQIGQTMGTAELESILAHCYERRGSPGDKPGPGHPIATMPHKHLLPTFLDGVVAPESYERWLDRKAVAHVRRDRKRGHAGVAKTLYKEAIHNAVLHSEGNDDYTGEPLHWSLISTYRNEDSKKGRHGYKAGFALLPTVDHVTAEASEASFRVCAWRTNDAKNDLSLDGFLGLCERVLKHAGYSVEKRG